MSISLKKLTPSLFKEIVDKHNKINAVNNYYNKLVSYQLGVMNTQQAALQNPLVQRVDKLTESLVGVKPQDLAKTPNLLERLTEIQNSLKNIDKVIIPSAIPAIAPAPVATVPALLAPAKPPQPTPPDILNILDNGDSNTVVDLAKSSTENEYTLGTKSYFIQHGYLIEYGTDKHRYKLTPGLAHLLTNSDMNEPNFTEGDKKSYLNILSRSGVYDILKDTKVTERAEKEHEVLLELLNRHSRFGYTDPTNPSIGIPSRFAKPAKQQKPTWERQSEEPHRLERLPESPPEPTPRRTVQSRKETPKKGQGIARSGVTGSATTVFLPPNPKRLMKRLDILVAEAEAGNPSGMNEASAILDYLKVDKRTYKQILKKFSL